MACAVVDARSKANDRDEIKGNNLVFIKGPLEEGV